MFSWFLIVVGVTLSTDALTITEGMSSNLTVLLQVPADGIEIDVSVTVFVTPLTGEGIQQSQLKVYLC